MCGIVGYTGKATALSPVLEGLRRLEYRGYDSAGIALAVTKGEPLWIEKRAGKLGNLESTLTTVPDAHSGIGHTRWATHGGPTDRNAHPHLDNEGKLALIHNGIIENYVELRAELENRGHIFKSETDTESVVHLLSDARKKHNGDLAAAMREVCAELRGSFTLLAIHSDEPGRIVGSRRNSPLVVGVGDGENFLHLMYPPLLHIPSMHLSSAKMRSLISPLTRSLLPISKVTSFRSAHMRFHGMPQLLNAVDLNTSC